MLMNVISWKFFTLFSCWGKSLWLMWDSVLEKGILGCLRRDQIVSVLQVLLCSSPKEKQCWIGECLFPKWFTEFARLIEIWMKSLETGCVWKCLADSRSNMRNWKFDFQKLVELGDVSVGASFFQLSPNAD